MKLMKGRKNCANIEINALSTPTETNIPKIDTFPRIAKPPIKIILAVMIVVTNMINGKNTAMIRRILTIIK